VVFESCGEFEIELVESGSDTGGGGTPDTVMERADDQREFDFEDMVGLEAAAVVTAQMFELTVDSDIMISGISKLG